MLAYWLGEDGAWGGIRILLAAACALGTVILLGRAVIPYLRSRQFLDAQAKGDSRKLDTLHAHKAATPTLGGIVLFAGVLLSVGLWSRVGQRPVLLLGGYALALATIGFLDDATKLKTGRKGVKARTKLASQLGAALVVSAVLYAAPVPTVSPGGAGDAATSLFLPFSAEPVVDLGAVWILLSVLVMTGAANAVNLTDGLDGLAAGTSVLAAVPLVIIAFVAGTAASSAAWGIPHVEGGLEVAVFLGALGGAGLGFLWFNCHPAQVFMGDTGSLPLGGCLGLAAVLCKAEWILLVAGGVLVAEALSVILQVASFKLRRKRIFLIAPLHHHFQFKGWPETRVTTRFWIVGGILSAVSMFLLRLR